MRITITAWMYWSARLAINYLTKRPFFAFFFIINTEKLWTLHDVMYSINYKILFLSFLWYFAYSRFSISFASIHLLLAEWKCILNNCRRSFVYDCKFISRLERNTKRNYSVQTKCKKKIMIRSRRGFIHQIFQYNSNVLKMGTFLSF